MRLKKLDVDVINELFEKAEHQQDVLVGIYRSIFRDWDVSKRSMVGHRAGKTCGTMSARNLYNSTRCIMVTYWPGDAG